MKRTIFAVTLAVFCFDAAMYGVPRYVKAREAERRKAYAQRLSHIQPLLLDPVTTGILNGAVRVETFRL